jgi:hypothetical protein
MNGEIDQYVIVYNEGFNSISTKPTLNGKVIGTSIDEISRKIESPDYVSEFTFDRSRYFPQVDFSDPANFAYFGSAQQYYIKAIENIYRFYPYDGSLKEKLQWHNESSYFDNYVFEYEYPRTNGYIEIGETWGTVSNTISAVGDQYKLSSAPQYVSVKGGPHAASVPTYTSGTYDKKLNFKESEQKANIFDVESRQMQNLTIDGVKGNTVEFWLKLPLEPSKSQTSPSHAYFDLWNGETLNSSPYGRFLIETRYNNTTSGEGDYIGDSFFHVTYLSGTTGVLRAKVAPKELTGSNGIDLAEWNHWAFSVENAATTLEIKLYANGNLLQTTLTGTTVQPVRTGSFNATIGAYKYIPDTDALAAGFTGEGYGTLTGSYIDEFRFWTIHRDSDDINFNWFKQIGGGTNTDYGTKRSKFYRDTNPVNLGVYYKFNEGITTSKDHDRVVLDYSGRVSNGFISNYTSAMRSTGSAIVEKKAAPTEFKDPIIYKFHPDIISYEHSASIKGREYDGRNSMFLQNMLPSWIIEEDEFKGKNGSLYLNQILASYLDNLYIQIQKMPRLKDMNYISGSSSGSINKPLPFADRLLSNAGFVVPKMFGNANIFESLADRDDGREFQRKLADVKNQIYSNIYNNLIFINKSKGTIKSITNMMRCFGVDDDLYSVNFYANNAQLDLKGNFLPKTIRKSYANFSTADSFEASVFQMTQSSNSNSVSFITGSYKTATEASPSADGWDTENSFTFETEVIFPNYPNPLDPGGRLYDFNNISASLFGVHEAPIEAASSPGDTTWATDDFSNFQVYAVREKNNNFEPESRNVRFILTSSNANSSTNGLIEEMASKTFKQVYNGDRWNLSVRVFPSKHPNVGYVSGSEDTEYTIQFAGFNMVGDVIKDTFDLTSSLTTANGLKFLPKNKRIYAGAHRTNFTGSLLCPTNVKISSCRYWGIKLDDRDLYSHALDPKNYGVYNAMQTSHLLQDRGGQYPVDVPKIKSLWMNWDFDTLTGSDTGEYNGEFNVVDFSSGSGENIYKSYISAGAEKQHTGRGVYFPSGNNHTGSISREYVYAYRQQVPENLNNLNAIKVLERDDEFFTKRTRPVSFSMSIEKSMYQAISEEMINFVAASQEASGLENLIGHPVNKYRGRYKDLEKLRNIFFRRISNNADVDKFIEYFKWLDTSISEMVQQLVPASSNFSSVRNIIESHTFERNKYRHKFPTLELDFPSRIEVQDLSAEYVISYNYVGSSEGSYEAAVLASNRGVRSSLQGTNVAIDSISVRNLTGWSNNHANTVGSADNKPNTRESIWWWKLRAPFGAETEKTAGSATADIAFNDLIQTATAETATSYETYTYGVNLNPVARQTADTAFDLSVDSGGESAAFNDQNKSRPKKDRNFRDVVFREAPAGSGTRLSFNTSTLARQPNTDTLDKINPNRKFKPEFEVQIPSMSTERGYDGRKYAPISFQSSSTDNPFVTGSSPWHIGYEVSTQHLQDYYLDNKDIPIQGPFTERNVGGYAYRHSGMHLHIGQTLHVKPEAWYAFKTITANPNGINFDFYNIFDLPGGVNAPRATMLREEVAKRPLNIKNIKSTTVRAIPAQTSLPPFNELGQMKVYNGNYEKDYQIVQIADRDTNNRYFVDNGGISTASVASTGTPSTSGSYDWTVPDRGRNEHIFVSRFSAPGGPEVNGQAFLNYEAGVYSPYNAMIYRNLSVRQPLQTLLTRHTAFGGYDSVDGSPTASYHKTQRNAVKRIEYTDIFRTAATSSAYDNYYVQHQIPQSDRQYAWITASATTTPLGFSQKDYANRSFASTDIAFVTSSDFGAFINTSLLGNGKYIFGRPASSAGALFLPQDFIGLNNFTYLDSDEMDNNTTLFKLNTDFVGATIVGGALGSATPVEGLNINLLKGNGPYGQSSWKQIQHSYHPIVRYMKGINRFSILTESITISPGDLKQQFLKTQTLQNFTEPMVSFKYKPIEHDLMVENDSGEESVLEIDSTYSNSLSGFANNKIDNLLNYKKDINDIQLVYNSLKSIYAANNIPKSSNPIKSLGKLSYREIVYPRERNTGLGKTRGRENYTVSSGSTDFNLRLGDSLAFWKNNINDRLRSDATARNAQGLIIASGSSYFGLTDMSIWPLDSEEPFYDLYAVSASITDGADPFYWAPLSPSSSALTTARAPRLANVNKNGELSYAGYIYGLFGINIQSKVTGSDDPGAGGPFPNYLADLNFKPTASFQYEFPNMMMSGSGPTTLLPRPTASLHLMAPYRTDILSGKTPWFNSYEDYSEDIRRLAKDYTVIPEFRITDNIDYYLKEGFFSDNNKFLDIIGSSLANTSSAASESSAFQKDFFKVYSHSDFMKHFSVIQEDHKKNNTAFVSKIRLEASAVKKLLPYQGFYPALRSVQLGQLFSSSYGPYITGSNLRDGDQERLAALYQPFFAPGIFFNSIKSGIAVSYPVHTGSAPDVFTGAGTTNANAATSGSIFISNQYQDGPNYSFPFEAILDPDQFLPMSSSLTSSTLNTLTSSVFMVYPNFTGSARTDDMDGFYAKQGVAGVGGDDPYTAARAAALGVNRNQPQIFFQWKGQSDPKYSLAASNFFAESVEFFLEKGNLTSFVSKPEKDFKSMVSGSTYFMDVLLYKTDDFVSYEGPSEGVFEYRAGLQTSASFLAAGSESAWHGRTEDYGDGLVNTTIGARGMHYGPSYKASPHVWGSSGTGSVPYAAFRAQDPTYAPHTPPYFYGTSRARIAFKPHVARDMGAGEAAKFTLEEILANAKVETSFQNENERAKTLQENNYRINNPAGQAQMQLSSSVNLFGQTTLKEVEYGVEKSPDGTYKPKAATTPVVQGTNDAWIIETKFECPSVNLAHMDTASLGAAIGDGNEKYHTRGIWKGYGVIPSGSEGLFLQLKESYPQITNSMDSAITSTLSGSLIDVCGFKATSERIGKIRSKKTISEAIIAVPIDEKGKFFSIDKDMFLKQKSNLESSNKALLTGDFGVETDIGETSITKMIQKMKKFSLPPQMDFINNPNVDPFVMYIFDFNHVLDKQDLSDIWQNLMPKISTTAQKASSAIEHNIGVEYEFFGQYKKGNLPDNIRWMVFKVKQKAKNNYFNITQQSEVAKGFKFTALEELQGIGSNPEAELTYSYNWPYDFFSLVELAQIEAEVTFEPPKE